MRDLDEMTVVELYLVQLQGFRDAIGTPGMKNPYPCDCGEAVCWEMGSRASRRHRNCYTDGHNYLPSLQYLKRPAKGSPVNHKPDCKMCAGQKVGGMEQLFQIIETCGPRMIPRLGGL
jgi:hypothetical protein